MTVKEIAVSLNIAEHKVFENIDSIAQRKLSELQCNREQYTRRPHFSDLVIFRMCRFHTSR